MKDLIFKDERYRIIGACFEVYKAKGCGFLEAVYQECLAIEFEMQGVLFVPQKPLALAYKGRPLKQRYTADFFSCNSCISWATPDIILDMQPDGRTRISALCHPD